MKSVKLTAVLLGISATVMLLSGCGNNQPKQSVDVNKTFPEFENRFLDAYWKQYPTNGIYVGYGKYYDHLPAPDKAYLASGIAFSNQWLDSLNALNYDSLNDNNKISFNIIKNQLESDKWYVEKLKIQEWNASNYNIAGACEYIINQPYAPLDERLRILTRFLQQAPAYYAAAATTLTNPTKEHTEMAIGQNKGGMAVFGPGLMDSVAVSGLSEEERTSLQAAVDTAQHAILLFIDNLQQRLDDTNYVWKDYMIGKELYTEKFKYDLVIDLSPEQAFDLAKAKKEEYTTQMAAIASNLWPEYYPGKKAPAGKLELIQKIFDKVQAQHATAAGLFDTLTNQVYELKKFILDKDMFNFDTAATPIVVRLMPEYARGFSVASAEFTPPYLDEGTTYYNIDDLTAYPKEKAEGALREYNNYASTLLSIHEAVPGHCMQGIYNKKSDDKLRSVFQNNTMIEGWAVYAEDVMMENGWMDNKPEMVLTYMKLKLRELANVMIDYEIQCLNTPKDSIMNLLVNECFQTKAQAEEKYHRATVSQVQLCTYYTGAAAIHDLRDAYKAKMGDQYSLKAFHEAFLSFGSSPVKYIREHMLKN